ncbi:MAG: hypothetical protein U0K65_02300 [Negativibacillus sp.]|nr:hypothetical protein [Negativibacillus sp.]
MDTPVFVEKLSTPRKTKENRAGSMKQQFHADEETSKTKEKQAVESAFVEKLKIQSTMFSTKKESLERKEKSRYNKLDSRLENTAAK